MEIVGALLTRPLAEVVCELRSRANGMVVNGVRVQDYYDTAADAIERWMRETDAYYKHLQETGGSMSGIFRNVRIQVLGVEADDGK